MTTTTQTRYQSRFKHLQEAGRKAYIPFTLLGWPNPEMSFEIMRTMIEAGVTALELGFAFSDPMSDGPIIQAAAQETLALRFTVSDGFDLIRRVRQLDSDIPIGLLVYYNLVLARGVERFFQDAADVGVDGILIADLPPEAAGEVYDIAHRYGVDLIFIASPLTSTERLVSIQQYASGFLYLVSRLGITGTESRVDTQLQALIERVHAVSSLPACVGFGISEPEHARTMYALGADGAITGSRIIQLIRESGDKPLSKTLKPYLASMMAET